MRESLQLRKHNSVRNGYNDPQLNKRMGSDTQRAANNETKRIFKRETRD